MQPETLNRSIQPTPTVHPRGFTPSTVRSYPGGGEDADYGRVVVIMQPLQEDASSGVSSRESLGSALIRFGT